MAILNVSELVEQRGGPACIPETAVIADATNGVVYVQQGEHAPGFDGWARHVDVHHSFGTHSAPWHIMQARSAVVKVTDGLSALRQAWRVGAQRKWLCRG